MAQPRGPEYDLPVHRRPSRRAYRLWNGARQRAKQKSLPFTITLDWVKEKLEKGVCEATGLDFGDPCTAFTPTLDQTSPGAGYTPDNVTMVVWAYNNAKGVFSHEDVLRMAQALVDVSKTRSP